MKKLKLAFLLSFLVINAACYSQDILFYKNGIQEKVKVTEVLREQIKYKKALNLEGPVYTIDKTDLYLVRYENGTMDVFSTEPVKPSLKEEKPGEQYQPPTEKSMTDPVKETESPRLHYGGPRMGITFISPGALSDGLIAAGKRPVITQFGWQLETHFFTLPNGTQGLLEFVPLVGGMEQGLFKFSMTGLVGLRTGKKGFEVGMGPTLTFGNEPFSPLSVAFAAGYSLRTENVVFPINLAIALPTNEKIRMVTGSGTQERIISTGTRISLLIGFNVKRRRGSTK